MSIGYDGSNYDMGLEKAHEGYEYQDLLAAFFILKEIVAEGDSEFFIDKKEFQGDRIDDFRITNKSGRQKIQIKYSGEVDHTFQKGDIAGDAVYGLALDKLYENWRRDPDKERAQFRLCLAWKAPTDKLLDFVDFVSDAGSFLGFATRSIKIKGEAIWPAGHPLPVSSWRRFQQRAKKIDRNSFLTFCDQLVIETTLPKFSLNLDRPGPLEDLLFQQVRKLGIGVFPNQHIKPDHFILSLVAIIKRARSKGHSLTTKELLYALKIRTDYGTIEQNFPVEQKENVRRINAMEAIIEAAEKHQKILLVGEPGSGKSWFIENLQVTLKKKGIKSVRHYCYTRLDDLLQKERIQLNIFFANLIYDILQAFPELRKVKEQRYASSLSELNLLLENIPSPTYLIIDGLDHIDRIFHFRSFATISRQDIAIIETLEKLVVSPMVKVIVTSQNIPRLNEISSFYKIMVPGWSEEDVRVLLKKTRVKNTVVRKAAYLSKVLLDKSAGNPLYLRYLVDEVKRAPGKLVALLHSIPAYSFNLSEYYNYLLSQLNMQEDVAQVLSGINFSVTKLELEEITGNGAYVGRSLEVLAPVLKASFAQSGYVIYHESFRRFIVDRLKANAVSLDKKIFSPIIEWFEGKDFFQYRKAYRYCLSFLLESGKFEAMLRYLTKTFVTDSVLNGQPWELIERNFLYFLTAASHQKDLAKIVLLKEMDKIIATTQAEFREDFSLYFEALGRINGFAYVSEYLLFDDSPVLDAAKGLKACYVCDDNGVVAPWEPYMELVRKERRLAPEDYRYYIRGMLVLEDGERVNNSVILASQRKDQAFLDTMKEQLFSYRKPEYIQSLLRQFSSLRKITKTRKKVPVQKKELLRLATEILAFEFAHPEQAIVLEHFFEGFSAHAKDKNLLKQLIDLFKGKNWFYNWVIYWLKIITLNAHNKVSFSQVKDAFDYLTYSTSPFLGSPRVCDLYSIEYLTFRSFKEGLSLVSGLTQCQEIIPLLTKVGSDTTTSLQRSQNGPLQTATLFRLFGAFVSDENREYINQVFEDLTRETEEYQLHAAIAEYKLQLSILYSLANDAGKAKQHFKEGIEYLLAYTMRKDLTLLDVIEGVEWMAVIDKPLAMEGLKASRLLIESAICHTDGRETDYFPITWFERFVRIDFHLASRYLLDALLRYRYNWRAERSLIDLLCHAAGAVNPLIEFYLAFTFPCNDSQNFISYRLHLYDRLKDVHPSQAEKLFAHLYDAVRPRQNRSISEDIMERYNRVAMHYGVDWVVPEEKSTSRQQAQKWYEGMVIQRKEFADMQPDELAGYINVNGIRQEDINALSLYISQYAVLDSSLKDLIQVIVRKNNRAYADVLQLDIIFERGDEVECYYWICRFFFDLGDWFEQFVSHGAFTKAIALDHARAMEFLFELMPSGFAIGAKHTFSSNLIRALIGIGHDRNEIKTMWKEVLDMAAYRLPFKEEVAWDAALTDEWDMTKEELFLCMLLARFKAATTERYRTVACGIKDILESAPAKMEKPLKWFIQHRAEFLQPAVCIVLQLLLDHCQRDSAYHLKFEKELTSLFPTRYFLTDWIIAKLFDLNIAEILLPPGIIYPSLSQDELNWFSAFNRRFNAMQVQGIDLDPIFGKHKAGFQRKYQEYFELYQNRVYEQCVSHIYCADFFLELMNVDLYNEFRDWPPGEEESLEKTCFIDTTAVMVYGKSFTIRPADLIKPSELPASFANVDVSAQADWIRLAHCERSLEQGSRMRTWPVTSYGAVVYGDIKMGILPYAAYRIFPFYLWAGEAYTFDVRKEVVFAVFQEDTLEFYKILWLNPTLVTSLGLRTTITDFGLTGTTASGETVLRMRTWLTDYLGDGMRTQLSNEIPRQEGTDLIIRKDYFLKLSEQFERPPSYVTIKREA